MAGYYFLTDTEVLKLQRLEKNNSLLITSVEFTDPDQAKHDGVIISWGGDLGYKVALVNGHVLIAPAAALSEATSQMPWLMLRMHPWTHRATFFLQTHLSCPCSKKSSAGTTGAVTCPLSALYNLQRLRRIYLRDQEEICQA